MPRKRWRFIGRTWESWIAYFALSWVAVKLIWNVWGIPADVAWWKLLLVYMLVAALTPKDLSGWFEKS